MKTTTFFAKLFLAFCFILMSSCSNDSIIDDINEGKISSEPNFKVVKVSASKLKSLGNENVSEDEYLLKFKDEETFKQVMDELAEMSVEDRLVWNEELNNFTSFAQEYENGMLEAESYYDRPGGYEEFKAKYPMFYFPEQGDDYGAYIPFDNELKAYSANENGRLMVGDEIINLETINSYDELLESGRGMVNQDPNGVFEIDDKVSLLSDGMKVKVAPEKQVQIKAVYMTPGSWWFQKRVMGDGSYQHSTGWRTYGSRKIKVDLRRETRTSYFFLVLPGGFRLEWHLEVSFRKKGFLGAWYNYSSKTSTTLRIEHFDSDGYSIAGKVQNIYLSQSGASSHDQWTDAYAIRHIKSNPYETWNNVYDYNKPNFRPFPRCLYEMPAYKANIGVSYQGIPEVLRFVFSAPTLYGYTNYTSDKLEWK